MNPLQDPRLIVWLGLLLLGTLIRAKGATVDPAFNPQIDGTVSQIAVQGDGRILVAGWFERVQGTARPGFARLNVDGSLDNSFVPELGTGGHVSAVAVGEDGIYVGGSFHDGRNSLIKLDASGAAVRIYSRAEGPDGSPSCLAVDSLGRLVVAGSFSKAGGLPVGYVARFGASGEIDTAFNSGLMRSLAIEAGVSALSVSPDGTITVGGIFEVNGAYSKLARLNADGSIDASYSGTPGEMLYTHAFLPMDNGQTFAAGQRHGGAFCHLLNGDRSVDASFQLPEIQYGRINALLRDASGGVLIGGAFSRVGSVEAGNLARLQASGAVDATFQANTDGMVMALAGEPSGSTLVGGIFSTVNGEGRRGLARLVANPIPAFLAITCKTNGELCAVVRSEAGASYRIESSTDLQTWTVLRTVQAEGVELEFTAAQNPSEARRFFRAIKVKQ